MIKNFLKNTNDIQDKIKNISKEDIKNSTTEVTGAVIENGIEVTKKGIFGIVNGIMLKIILLFLLLIIILSAGCIGTTVTIDKLTNTNITQQEKQHLLNKSN